MSLSLIEQFSEITIYESSTSPVNKKVLLERYKNLLSAALSYSPDPSGKGDSQESVVKVTEQSIYKIGDLLKENGSGKELSDLVLNSLEFLGKITKAKTTKIVKTLLDNLATIKETIPLQVETVQKTIEWATKDKRLFLKQQLETRLASLYLENKMYSDALTLIGALNSQLKKLDDKTLLMDVQLLESRVYLALRNLPKSRAALTSARTSANAIYCPPLMQAQLDLQSGILHAEEKDYKTGFSYFYETCEGFSGIGDERAVLALKYMLLCKIMLNLPEDVNAIINGKLALKYAGREVSAMSAIAKAHQNRSLKEFESALAEYKQELSNDPIISTHLSSLYDSLLSQNLLRIIEPYSRVQISYVAELVQLDCKQVEAKLSLMILDKVFNGILDQGNGDLVVFDEIASDKTYATALETIKHMGNAVESLYEKAALLSC
ncbi:26S proteasome regulatory subunit rpn6 [Nowakowskiella sp. JEL0407]|nr:26S proteasome regulatory subunit rpn6 [Nowakowskiella sp. JEL0407]